MAPSRQFHELHRTLQLCYTEFQHDKKLIPGYQNPGLVRQIVVKFHLSMPRRRFLKTFAIL